MRWCIACFALLLSSGCRPTAHVLRQDEATSAAESFIQFWNLGSYKLSGAPTFEPDADAWVFQLTRPDQVEFSRLTVSSTSPQRIGFLDSKRGAALAGQSTGKLFRFANFGEAKDYALRMLSQSGVGYQMRVVAWRQPQAPEPVPAEYGARLIELNVLPLANGYPVHRRGATLELDTESGTVLFFASNWALPPLDPPPSELLSKKEAVEAIARANGLSHGWEPRQSELAYVPWEDRRFRLSWRIDDERVGYFVDATNGRIERYFLSSGGYQTPQAKSREERLKHLLAKEIALEKSRQIALRDRQFQRLRKTGFMPARRVASAPKWGLRPYLR